MEKDGKNHFTQHDIRDEGDLSPRTTRILKVDAATAPVVQQYQYGHIMREGEGSYAATRQKYGPLAATDQGREPRGQRDRRFSLNPLLKEPLSIEEEERRAIEEKVREQVEALAVEASEKARKEGYEAGLQQGHEEASRRIREDGAGRMASFESLLEQAEKAKTEIFRANERFLMEVVFRIARTVALKEISADPEYLLKLARDLIERIGVRDHIRLRISPADAATIVLLKPELERTLGTLKNLNIEASAQVAGGGCIVETEWNVIDASVETQLKGMYEALLGHKGPVSEAPAGAGSPPPQGKQA